MAQPLHATHATARRRRRGIALLEALIAILLLSISALAYAALQIKGLKTNHSALWRSKATLLAYDMADRMRANRTGVLAGSYNTLTQPQKVADCGVSADCLPERMALFDYDQWSTALGAELPAGSGVICLDATPDDGEASAHGCDGDGTMLAVKVFWSEGGTPARLAVGVRP